MASDRNNQFEAAFKGKVTNRAAEQTALKLLRCIYNLSGSSEDEGWVSLTEVASKGAIGTPTTLASVAGPLRRAGLIEAKGAELKDRKLRLTDLVNGWLATNPRLFDPKPEQSDTPS